MRDVMINFGKTLRTHPTRKLDGVVSTYVPWMISAAVGNVCKMQTGTRYPVEDVHDSLLASFGLGTLREDLTFIESASKRECAALYLMDRCSADLKNQAELIRGLGYDMGKVQFERIYPYIRRVCDQLDLFRGAPNRRIAGRDGTPMFVYAKVMKMELDSLQDIAGLVRGCINEQLVSAKVLSDLGKLVEKRRKIFRRLVQEARAWKKNILKDIANCIGVCEGLNKQRRRAQEFAGEERKTGEREEQSDEALRIPLVANYSNLLNARHSLVACRAGLQDVRAFQAGDEHLRRDSQGQDHAAVRAQPADEQAAALRERGSRARECVPREADEVLLVSAERRKEAHGDQEGGDPRLVEGEG